MIHATVSDNLPTEPTLSTRVSPSTHLLHHSKRQQHQTKNLRKLLGRIPHPRIPSPTSDEDFSESISKCPFASNSMMLFQDEAPSQEQIDLVRTSWERVTEIRLPEDDRNVSASHAFGIAFYNALFEMDSNIQELFDNVFQQARALTGMISYITRAPTLARELPDCCGARNSVDSDRVFTIRDINARKRNNEDEKSIFEEVDPERLAIQMRELGARHYFYKVQPHHLELVGPAFVSALKARLRDEYTEEIGNAWVKANSYVALNMKIGFESQQAWEEQDGGRAYHHNKVNGRKHKGACTIQ